MAIPSLTSRLNMSSLTSALRSRTLLALGLYLLVLLSLGLLANAQVDAMRLVQHIRPASGR